jgi:DNA-binding NarL/FixJ family response regulator
MQIAVIGRSRWAAEGVAGALRHEGAIDARAFDDAAALHAASRWPEVTVALVGTREQVAAVRAALAPGAPVLWLIEPGAARLSLDSGDPTGLLYADTDIARLRAALAALSLGLSVHEPALQAAPARNTAELRDPLTARELEVFELLAKGLPNREIASVLGISPHTAKFHVAQILDKTGSATRTEAVGQGLRLGLVGV